MSQKPAKFLIPLCMILGIALLWYLNQEQQDPVPQTPSASSVAVASSHAPINKDLALSDSHFDLEGLKKYNLPIIVDFGADSCIPCKEMAPVLIKLHGEMQGKAIIKFVDVWKNPKGAQGYPVQVIPTQIFFLADGTPYVPKAVKDIDFTTYSTKDSKEHVFTVHQGGLTEDQLRRILQDMGAK